MMMMPNLYGKMTKKWAKNGCRKRPKMMQGMMPKMVAK
jgi:hypothetical protein